MATINQLLQNLRIKKIKKIKKPALQKCPQKKGICLRVFYANPKKPNSAVRKVSRVILSNRLKVTCHIPGQGHKLQKHSHVLIRGGRVRDLPGIKYRIIRGKLDLQGVLHRLSARSKYGVKKI